MSFVFPTLSVSGAKFPRLEPVAGFPALDAGVQVIYLGSD